MIKLFRNIRQNLLNEGKTSRYLKYAIGEIILVVIGILIALQVNTWNENRKFQNYEKELLENMLFNLKSASINGYSTLETNKSIDSLHQKLYQIGIIDAKDIQLKDPNDIRRMVIFQPITKKNDPFIIDKIKNKRIKSEVVSYFLALDETDKFIVQLQNIMIDGMRAYLRQKNQHNLSALFDSKSKSSIQDENSMIL
jgi:hypothetical protein